MTTFPGIFSDIRRVFILLVALVIVGPAAAASAQDNIAGAQLTWTQSDKQALFDLQVTVQLFSPPPAIGTSLNPVMVNFGDGTTLNVSPIVSSSSYTGTSNIDRAVAHAFFSHTYPAYGPQPMVRATLCCRSQTLSDGNAVTSIKVATAVTLGTNTVGSSPAMSAPPITRCAPGVPCTIAMGGSARDGSAITYRLATPAESGMAVQATGTIDPVTGLYTFTPPSFGGRFQAQVVAQTATSSSAIEFVVSSNAAFISPPTISSSACGTTISAFIGVPLSFSLTVSGGADTTLFLSGAPDGSALTATGTPDEYQFNLTPSLGFSPGVMQIAAVGSGGQSTCLVTFVLRPTHFQFLSGVVRDFSNTPPDFNLQNGDAGIPIVASTLGADGKPVFAPGGTLATIASATSFNQWFNAATQSVFSITLTDRDDVTGHVFSALNDPFYPIDNLLGGNQGDAHNRFFTYEIHTFATYTPGDVLTFTSSDDMWVFVGGTLAVDLGGIHDTATAGLHMDDVRVGGQPLRAGIPYRVDIFYAHRGSAHAPVFGVQQPLTTLCDVLPGTPLPQVTLADLMLLGQARLVSGTLQLARAGLVGPLSTAAWAAQSGVPTLVPLGDGFSTDFDFSMTAAAEGFAFVMQTSSPAARGGDGANLGYGNLDHSLAIEFDPKTTPAFDDPLYQHIAVMSRFEFPNSANHTSTLGVNTTDRPLVLNDGLAHHVHIEFRPGDPVADGPRLGWLYVYFDRDMTNSQTPAAVLTRRPVIQAQIDSVSLDRILQGGAAYLGFTAGIGDGPPTTDLTISNWSYGVVAPSAIGSTIETPGLALLGKPGATVIETGSACSVPMSYGGWSSGLTAAMSIGAHTIPATIADRGDGTYAVGYTPDATGIWTLRPSFGGTEIFGSPVAVRVNAETALVLQPITAVLGQRVILMARLTRAFDSSPIANAAVTFSIGTLHVTTNTGLNGQAEFLTPPLTPDMIGYEVTYAGSPSNFLLSADAVTTVTAAKVQTSLIYTGNAGVPAGGSLQASALLASPAGPMPGQPVTFTLGGLSVTATTDPTGKANAVLTGVPGPAGPRTLTVSYAGTDINAASTTTAEIHVNAPTMLTYTGATTFNFGSPVAVAARLVGAPDQGVPNEVVTFTLPDTSVVQATTDLSGFASATLSPLPLGPNAIVIRFAGDPSASLLPAARTVTLTIVDGTAPVIAALGDVTVEATSGAGAIVTFPPATATDTVDPAPVVSVSPASGSQFALGATLVTVTATDTAGNSSTAQFTVHVQDTIAPQVVVVPGNIALTATSAAGAVAMFSASATDAVDGTVTATCAPASGSTFPVGTTSVVCTATDAHENQGTAAFSVTVAPLPGQAPKITTPAQKTEEATGPGGAVVTFNVTARVPGDGPVPVTCAPGSGSLFPVGVTSVACTATSASGVVATATFPVTVRDTKAPKLDLPSRQVVEAAGPAGTAVSFTASATDLVDGSPSVVCLPASGSVFPLGRTDVACTATDHAGNARSDTFAVVVRDTVSPEIVSITPSQAVLPPTGVMTDVQFAVVATDAVDPAPVCMVTRVASNVRDVDHNGVPDWQITGPLTVSLEAATKKNRNRNYVVTIKCTDASGNPSREKTTVVVSNQ